MATSLCLRLRGVLSVLAFVLVIPATGLAGGKTSGHLIVRDVLTLPNQTARIEAHLSGNMPAGGPGWGGVSLQLSIDGKPLATAKTDEGGQAVFDYIPKTRGTNVITVTLVETASVEAEKAEATLCVWERRRPILLVEMAAIMQPGESSAALSSVEVGTAMELPAQPVSDAADELSRLTQYYYNVVYVPTGEQLSALAAPVGAVRRWLESHKFPVGFVVAPQSGDLNASIESFKQAGWTTMKTGIGRTRAFADTLLRQRMEVVVVPGLPKGELPRKAKAAKDWKEVRKKL
jgi:hypothetical protein